MNEVDYQTGRIVGYVVLFIGFVISVNLINQIQKLLVGKLSGILLSGAAYLIAFVLMIFIIPKIAGWILNKS